MMFSQRDRRFSNSSHPGVVFAFIVMGTKRSGTVPAITLSKPGCATPMMVSGFPLTRMLWLITAGSEPSRCFQKR